MIASPEQIRAIIQKYDLPPPLLHCYTNATTFAYLIAFADRATFDQIEFWTVPDTERGNHIYPVLPIDGVKHVFNAKITWPDGEFPDFSYNDLIRDGMPTDRKAIDRFVGVALEGGTKMHRTIKLLTQNPFR